MNDKSSRENAKKSYTIKDIQNAISPFEDALLQQLPSKEEILARAKKHQSKKKIRNSALVLCMAACGGGLYWLNPVYYSQHLMTQTGEIKKIELNEGSEIHLNTATRLTIRYRLRSREIELQQGEATFSVKHYPWQFMRPLERRFIVTSGDLQVEDIGTIFNVRRYHAEHSVVTVLQGQVRISLLNRPDIAALELYQQQRAEYVDQQLRSETNHNSDIDMAWHQGHLQFDAIPLTEVIAEFQRYQTLNVQFSDQASQKMRISGRFKALNAEQFMQILPEITAVRADQQPTGQWVVRKK